MDSFNPTVVTTVIAVAAIVSPVLTTIINNLTHLIEKFIDNKEKQREKTSAYIRNILENYLRCAGRYLVSPTATVIEDYKEAYALALLYVPNKIENQMKSIDNLLQENNEYTQKILEQLISSLKRYIAQL